MTLRHVRQERRRVDQPDRVRRALGEAGRATAPTTPTPATWTGSSSRRSSSTCRAAVYRTNHTTPPEFRGDQIRPHLQQREQRRGDDQRSASRRFRRSSSSASGYSRQHLVEPGHGAQHLHARTSSTPMRRIFKSMKGQHTFKTGMRFERFGNDVLDGALCRRSRCSGARRTPIPTRCQTSTGKYGYYTAESDRHDRQGALEQLLVLVPGPAGKCRSRLTVNVGVRTENEHIPSFKDQTQFPDALDITFGFKDKIAPRAGFAYDVKGDGKWKAYGSYGWFYDITSWNCRAARSAATTGSITTWTLDEPDYDEDPVRRGNHGLPGHATSGRQRLRPPPQLEPGGPVLRGILQPAGHDRHRSEPQAGEVGRVHGWSRSRVEPDDVARRPIRPQVDVPDDRRHGHLLQGHRGLPDRQPG